MENEKRTNYQQESVFSKKCRAGKRRTYFFDVKSTKTNDYFLTITESKKRPDDSYQRFKIFLYKEDFNKFLETLTETIDHIKKELMPEFDFDAFSRRDENYEPPPEGNIKSPEEITGQFPQADENSDNTPPPPSLENDDELKM